MKYRECIKMILEGDVQPHSLSPEEQADVLNCMKGEMSLPTSLTKKERTRLYNLASSLKMGIEESILYGVDFTTSRQGKKTTLSYLTDCFNVLVVYKGY